MKINGLSIYDNIWRHSKGKSELLCVSTLANLKRS